MDRNHKEYVQPFVKGIRSFYTYEAFKEDLRSRMRPENNEAWNDIPAKKADDDGEAAATSTELMSEEAMRHAYSMFLQDIDGVDALLDNVP